MAEALRPSDADLVAEAVKGDRKAFAALYTRHRDRVFCIAVGVLCDRETALDLTQDVFCKLLHALARYDGRAAFTTWLHRVTLNACYDALRRRTPIAVEDPSSLAAEQDLVVTDDAGVLDVRAALARLPLDQRSVVVMVDMVGYGYEDAADALGIPVGTVKSRLARGRLRVADILSAGNRTHTSDRPIHGGGSLG